MSNKTVATLTHVGSDVPKEQAVPLLLARIMTKVKLTEGGCWEWQGWKNTVGYPEATLGGKRYMVHRFMYEALRAGSRLPAVWISAIAATTAPASTRTISAKTLIMPTLWNRAE